MWFHLRLLEACNLSCSHCYARNRDPAARMDVTTFSDVLATILAIDERRRHPTVVYLGGGEPLIHPDFPTLLAEACQRVPQVNLLTNGIGVVPLLPTLLRHRDKLCVQVSIDGGRVINDRIRGAGTFDAAVAALVALHRQGVRHWLSYTVSLTNWVDYEEILDVARSTGSHLNNVTPYTGDPALMLSYRQWKELKYRFERTAERMGWKPAHGPSCCGFNYRCAAFCDGITVNPDGTLAGCARVPETVGSYRSLTRHLRDDRPWMHETCMKAAWGGVQNFNLLTRLEG
jgi:mycofactocin biosynthetic radical S-adenosylmethionine protein MftC